MSQRSALVLPVATLALTLLAAWLVYGTVSGEALLGFDGYPLIAASAFHSIADPLAVFGDELMGGRYPDGRFYRPIVHLTFGVDHALGGLDPAQYARTDIALAALTSTILGLLASALAVALRLALGFLLGQLFRLSARTFRLQSAPLFFAFLSRALFLAPRQISLRNEPESFLFVPASSSRASRPLQPARELVVIALIALDPAQALGDES